MKFSSPEKIRSTIEGMRDADKPLALNRAHINRLFNGEPPYTEQEADENNINTNVNFLEGTKIAHDARRQYFNAFFGAQRFLSVTVDIGPAHKRGEWGTTITNEWNRLLAKSLQYLENRRSAHAQVTLHGIGPAFWQTTDDIIPRSVAISDVLIPSRTLQSLENLEHFAIYRSWTAAELFKKITGKQVDKGWNIPAVKKQLKEINDKIGTQVTESDQDRAEDKMVEHYKADLGYYGSDQSPTIKTWDFCYLDEGNWKRTTILDSEPSTSKEPTVLYKSDRSIGDEVGSLIHFQYGDCSNVAPFLYHSIRSLGFMLYSVCHLMNRLRCKWNDHLFEQLLMYFRNVGSADAEKVKKVDLFHLGIIPDGLAMVPANERYQVRYDLIREGMSQNRQLMSENSSSFTQDVNDGTQKEMTATETMARVNSASAMVGSMLTMAYKYEGFLYDEMARRLCLPITMNKMAVKFQSRCLLAGVPPEALNPEAWNVEPERVMGAGNKTLQIAQADRLMAARPMYDPDPQREILRIYTLANTDNPDLAQRLVPEPQSTVTDAMRDAQLTAAALMQGMPVAPNENVNPTEYTEALLQSMASVVQRVEQSGGMATQQEVMGLIALGQLIEHYLQRLSQDPNEKERVRQYGDMLGNLMNQVKAYGQRLQEQQQANGEQGNPELAAKLQAMVISAESAARIKEAKAAQQMQHKEQSHQMKLMHSAQDAQLQKAALDLKTAGEIKRDQAKAKAKPEPSKPKAE